VKRVIVVFMALLFICQIACARQEHNQQGIGGDFVVYIKDNNGFKEIWKKNNETNEEMLLIDRVDAVASETRKTQRITAIYGNKVIVSTDEKYLFFITDAWETSGALFMYDLLSDKLVYLTDAYSIRQITKGEYMGLLVIGKHQYPLAGNAVDLLWVYNPHTKENVELFADDSNPLFDFVEEEYFEE